MKTDNELIAEFMGAVYYKDDIYNTPEGLTRVERMRYHESWDWLMPVLPKINEIMEKDGRYIGKQKGYLFQDYCLLEIDIKLVYDTVVEFIKWYNNESKESNK